MHDITWIPAAPDHILEDGLLLIAVHVLRDATLRQLAHTQLQELIDGSLVDLASSPTTDWGSSENAPGTSRWARSSW